VSSVYHINQAINFAGIYTTHLIKIPFLSKKRIINRPAKPRMYKFPTCTLVCTSFRLVHQQTNFTDQPKKTNLPRSDKLVCTSFRLVHRKANFTNQKKQTFTDQLNLVCTSFRLVHRKANFTNQKKQTFPNQLNLVCTSFRLVHRKATFTNQKKQTFTDQLNPRMYKFPTCTPKSNLHQPKKTNLHRPAKPPYVQVSDLYTNRQTSPTNPKNTK